MKMPHDDEPIEPADMPQAYPLEQAIEDGICAQIERVQRDITTPKDFDTDMPPEELEEGAGGWIQRIPQLKPWQQRFCWALVERLGVISLAAHAARICVGTVKKYREQDELFGFVVDEILAYCGGLHKASLIKAATVGVLQPVFQGGIRVGWKRVLDVRAMEVLLKSTLPEEFDRDAHAARSAGATAGRIAGEEAVKGLLLDAAARLFGAKRRIEDSREKAAKVREITG